MSAVDLAVVTVLSCAGNMGGDVFGTVMNIAENRGHENLAGVGDVGADLCSKFILVAYGGTALTHHGWLGWLCVLPVLLTGFLTTKYTTRLTARLLKEDSK